MLFTFFYMIATSIQAWRISALKTRLSAIFQKAESIYPSIMLYTKPSICKSREHNGQESSMDNEYEAVQNLMSSHLCLNKSLAKLGDLLWCQGDTRLCTIYPHQKVDISEWLVYPNGETLFPLYAHNCYDVSRCQDLKMHMLIEADLETRKPFTSIMATKLEDYGLIVTWTANRNLSLLMESDLDNLTKLAIAVMEGQCYINNGLLLTRIESVSVMGKPCIYDKEQLNPLPDKKLVQKAQWDAYVKKLRTLSSTARLVAQQNMPLEVAEMPGVVIFPKHKGFILSNETDDKSPPSSPVLPTPSQTPGTADLMVEDTAFSLPQPAASSDDSLLSTSKEPLSENIEELHAPEALEEIPKASESKDKQTVHSETSTNRVADVQRTIKKSAIEKSSMVYSTHTKPPNVLIYGNNATVVSNIKSQLETALGTDKYASHVVCHLLLFLCQWRQEKYTIYRLSSDDVQNGAWIDEAALVVVSGDVGIKYGTQFVDYIIHGGKLLALCSDILHYLLPIYKTAELCEQELIRFSYGKWKNVNMTHRIFCYEKSSGNDAKKTIHPPASGNIKDKVGTTYSLDVKVLATEDACRAASILCINIPSTGGKAIISQIHLEEIPSTYQSDGHKYNILKQYNTARLEIFNDLLSTHLGMEIDNTSQVPAKYSPAFFLGRHELKLEMLDTLKPKMEANSVLKMTKMNIQFCSKSTEMQSPTPSFLPVMLHQCPDNFSTIEYFENLTSKELGRLVIYADVLTSSMDVVDGHRLQHGLAVIPRYQTQGQGRGGNVWLSPAGCAMFTLQLHIPKKSTIGDHITLIQHLVAVAVVSAVKSRPGYQDIDLQLKWPNDIYAGKTIKIGGVLMKTQVDSDLIVSNIGAGINLSNSAPTCCINNIISMYNKVHRTNLSTLSYECFLARVFSEIEKLLTEVQKGDIDHFLDMYHEYWMHDGANVTVISENGDTQEAKILGIDDYGFLRVRGEMGNIFSVHPDGNRYDLLKGLIIPK